MEGKPMKSAVLAIVVAFLAGCAGSGVDAPKISPAQAEHLIQTDSTLVILDVRTPEEFNGPLGHLGHAMLIPVQKLDERVGELEPYRSRTIVVYCRTGHRGGRATALLKEKGFNALNIDGGITRWDKEHLPVVMEVQDTSTVNQPGG